MKHNWNSINWRCQICNAAYSDAESNLQCFGSIPGAVPSPQSADAEKIAEYRKIDIFGYKTQAELSAAIRKML